MTRIWGMVFLREKRIRDIVVTLTEADLDAALEEICRPLDVPHPVVLKKHRGEFERFFRTAFRPEDFMESVHFTRLELEVLREDKKKDAARAASYEDD